MLVDILLVFPICVSTALDRLPLLPQVGAAGYDWSVSEEGRGLCGDPDDVRPGTDGEMPPASPFTIKSDERLVRAARQYGGTPEQGANWFQRVGHRTPNVWVFQS